MLYPWDIVSASLVLAGGAIMLFGYVITSDPIARRIWSLRVRLEEVERRNVVLETALGPLARFGLVAGQRYGDQDLVLISVRAGEIRRAVELLAKEKS